MNSLKDSFKKIFESSNNGSFIDKRGKRAFKISDKWIMTEDRDQLVLRYDGVEYYAFTFHSGINYEYPERILGISKEQQRKNNL